MRMRGGSDGFPDPPRPRDGRCPWRTPLRRPRRRDRRTGLPHEPGQSHAGHERPTLGGDWHRPFVASQRMGRVGNEEVLNPSMAMPRLRIPIRHRHWRLVRHRASIDRSSKFSPTNWSRPVVRAVRPQVDGGRRPAKTRVGEFVAVEADAFVDGHDSLVCDLRARQRSGTKWTSHHDAAPVGRSLAGHASRSPSPACTASASEPGSTSSPRGGPTSGRGRRPARTSPWSWRSGRTVVDAAAVPGRKTASALEASWRPSAPAGESRAPAPTSLSDWRQRSFARMPPCRPSCSRSNSGFGHDRAADPGTGTISPILVPLEPSGPRHAAAPGTSCSPARLRTIPHVTAPWPMFDGASTMSNRSASMSSIFRRSTRSG